MTGTQRNTTIRDRHRKAIARTKPPCALCGGEIDYGLKYLDPMSYVVDHVLPVAKGGTDELANKQAAHRRPGAATGRSQTSSRVSRNPTFRRS